MKLNPVIQENYKEFLSLSGDFTKTLILQLKKSCFVKPFCFDKGNAIQSVSPLPQTFILHASLRCVTNEFWYVYSTYTNKLCYLHSLFVVSTIHLFYLKIN